MIIVLLAYYHTSKRILALGGNNTVRNERERGQMGVMTRLCTLGCTMGPPMVIAYE